MRSPVATFGHGLAALMLAAVPVFAQTPASKPIAPKLSTAPRFGDFDEMLRRRSIRVLVPYSRTLYFSDKGHERGLTAENVRDFEAHLNKKYRNKLHNRPITVVLIPTRRDHLIPHLADGLGDIAAGNLTMTPERLLRADFFAPDDLRDTSELVLTNRNIGSLSSVNELSGRTVSVRASSSYYSSLLELNRRFEAEGRAPVRIEKVAEALEDEDLMEMLDAEVIDATVVDDWLARMWSSVFPDVIVNEKVAVRENGNVGWAVRRNSPLLLAEIEGFYKAQKKTGAISYRFAQYQKKVKRLHNPTAHADWKRFEQTNRYFEKYGRQYGFDPLLLAALGFQESRLDQSARSSTGAIGIMQLMPATGKSMRVGDITVPEANIHAGTKYINELLTRYFTDASFEGINRALFAFASYNAGPNRIARLRKTAEQRGLDPDVWFDNVEIVVSEKVGRETTTYVRNILKYYVSYKLTLDRQREQQRARDEMKSEG